MSETTHPTSGVKFGTFRGVFLPTLLTILGAVLYLRVGWVVGNAGLGGALLVMVLAHSITICTGLSIATVATNIRVRAGGPFSIISQSLGLEVSGSVTVPFYMAQAIAVAFYVFAFTEGWRSVFPEHPEIVVAFVALAVIFAIAIVSASLVSRAHLLILVTQIVALGAFFIGVLPNFHGAPATPQLWGTFPEADFWGLFAVFFPGVTGILAGVNLSGNLRNPRRAIPIGLLAAIGLAFAINVLAAIWLARAATPDELVSNFTMMIDASALPAATLAGLLAATFSAGLTSLVSAPRLLQAIAENNIVPGGEKLATVASDGEPRRAIYLTAMIAVITILVGLSAGGLNAIAPLMTMFYLITYGVLNAVVVIEQTMSLASFRPRFRIPRLAPLIGLIGCLLGMFLINPLISLAALGVIGALYTYLGRRTITNPYGDVRSGLFVSLAEWAAMRVSHLPDRQERAWKPNIFVAVSQTEEMLGEYRFLQAATTPRGSVHVLGIYAPGEETAVEGLTSVASAFTNDGAYCRVSLLENENFTEGMRMGFEALYTSLFRPNAVFLNVNGIGIDDHVLQTMLGRCEARRTGALIFAPHAHTGLGREQNINVWIREQGPDWEIGMRLSSLNLSLLMAYTISLNWNGHISLVVVVEDDEEAERARAYLQELMDMSRMPRTTRAVVGTGDFKEYIQNAPRADLNIFGATPNMTVSFARDMVEISRASCLFVQDSGHESALA
jgi:solute carrier family 12 sodium/potassium/chloride transporter 2